MLLLADENVPRALVLALRGSGQETAWVRDTAPGISDREVLAWASRDGLVLLTFDKDFGELARAARLPSTCGVILLRVPLPLGPNAGASLARLIVARQDWAGFFSVIDPGRVRMRPLHAP